MNSKEALEHICKTCDNKCCPYIHYEKSRCVWYGIIKQDVEVLDKLKELSDVIVSDYGFISLREFILTLIEDFKDTECIKEWLEKELKEYENNRFNNKTNN